MDYDRVTLSGLSDAEVVSAVSRLTAVTREATADVVAALAELDERRLYLGEGCSSLFTYCTERLHLSEWEAYHRIAAARAGRRFPAVLDKLRDGSLTMSAVGVLAQHLTEENVGDVLAAANHRGKRQVEELVARLQPRPERPASVRKLPEKNLASNAAASPASLQPGLRDSGVAGLLLKPGPSVPAAAPRPGVVRAVAPARYQVTCTISAQAHEQFRRAQDLLRHVNPNGNAGVVIERALSALLRELDRAKFALTDAPRTTVPSAPAPEAYAGRGRGNGGSRSRVIPAAVRRAVWTRDGGQCAFVGTAGRCTERGRLEFHHRVPFADGGTASVDNITLACALCRYRHNRHYADSRIMPRRQRDLLK